jgi:mono/diheme cytochrome c family protein
VTGTSFSLKLARPAILTAMAAIAIVGAGLAFAPGAVAEGDNAAAEDLAKGREIFIDWSCGSCHELQDAGANGHVGPSLDGNDRLSKQFVLDRVTNGMGAMPGFGGQMTDEEIDQLSTYISAVSKPAG